MAQSRHDNKVTIIDVARAAEVSAGTVSNALTGKRPVAAATRQRILRVIEELGYRPNLLARGLVNRSSMTLGVVASGLEYYGPSRTLIGIEQQANRLGYSLLLDLLHSPVDDDIKLVLNDLVSRRVDGIIWAVHEIGNNRGWIHIDMLRKLPPIIFLTMKPIPGVTVISTDNRAGASLATQHLLNQGRRAIGLITGPLDWWEAQERCLGWSLALERAGYEPLADLMAEGSWSAASGEQALYQLLQQHPDMDAVFASNDQMALGALRAAHLLKRRVPDDLAVVGYDNTPESAFFWPPLTTIRQHLVELGQASVQELEKIIQAPAADHAAPASVLLAPELIVRESSGSRLCR